jgi:hypothetical protein
MRLAVSITAGIPTCSASCTATVLIECAKAFRSVTAPRKRPP